MLPIKSWRIHYADGSVFSSRDGSWAEAPSFGVVCVVYYHVHPYKTIHTEEEGTYAYLGDVEGEPFKIGLWMDSSGYYRVLTVAGSFPEVD